MSYYSEIQNAFLDGLEEIYHIMFTDEIQFRFLDESSTNTNVYKETSNKVYSSDPIQLIGRVRTTFEQGELPVEDIQVDAIISIPTKQLITKEIAHETEQDLEVLKKGLFSYKGIDYIVDKVTPKTLVADKWHIYDFQCRIEKKSSYKKGLSK